MSLLREVLLVVLAALLLGVFLGWDLMSSAVRGGDRVSVAADANPTRHPAPDVAETSRGRRPVPDQPALEAAGARVFFAQCSACHGPRGDWPIALRLKGRTRDEFYALLDHLPAVNAAMPGFHGTDEERHALAAYLASLTQAGAGPD